MERTANSPNPGPALIPSATSAARDGDQAEVDHDEGDDHVAAPVAREVDAERQDGDGDEVEDEEQREGHRSGLSGGSRGSPGRQVAVSVPTEVPPRPGRVEEQAADARRR